MGKSEKKEMEFAELREAIETMELVDGHAHNIVSLDSTFPFINSFSEATGDALSFTPHSLSFKRNLREISELYGTESSLVAVEEYRRLSGLQAISSKCFKAAGISAVLIDDGLKLDKMHDIEWHRSFVPFVGRILRIERLAEQILDGEPDGSTWTLDKFTSNFLKSLRSVADGIVGLKSIAAYRSGLEINPNVTNEDAEEDTHRVYLDFGLAVPKLSVHGMLSSVKELLELAPINKVMFSTDGYAVPETYYLGAKKAREVIFSVLCDACIDGDLSVAEATEAAKGIFSQNAIEFYKINAGLKSSDLKASLTPSFDVENAGDISASFVRIIWVDASGQHRCRVVTAKRFNNVVKKNGVGLTFACMAMSSLVDGPADEANLTATGEIRLMPDLSTRWNVPWAKKEDMVLADMHLKPGEPWEYCPREALRRVTKVLKDEFDLEVNAGFETEFFLLKKLEREGKEELVPIDSTPYCSTAAFDAVSPLFHEIIAALNSMNIEVEQLHAEAGKGQFELALGHTVCTCAADNLIFTREVVKAVGRKHGLLATFVPKCDLHDVGSGSHVHLSLWQNGKNIFIGSGGSTEHGISTVGEQFMAGVLDHLPSIMAFTAPVPNSYDRIQPQMWSGAYQCWGKENREAALRTACPPGIPAGLVSNFEVKSFDGCANPHLGLAAIVAAGIDGLRRHLHLPEPIDGDPGNLEGKLKRLPRSLSESLEALRKDNVLHEIIGEKLLVAIKGVRKAEIDNYSKNKDAYKQLIHRY